MLIKSPNHLASFAAIAALRAMVHFQGVSAAKSANEAVAVAAKGVCVCACVRACVRVCVCLCVCVCVCVCVF